MIYQNDTSCFGLRWNFFGSGLFNVSACFSELFFQSLHQNVGSKVYVFQNWKWDRYSSICLFICLSSFTTIEWMMLALNKLIRHVWVRKKSKYLFLLGSCDKMLFEQKMFYNFALKSMPSKIAYFRLKLD